MKQTHIKHRIVCAFVFILLIICTSNICAMSAGISDIVISDNFGKIKDSYSNANSDSVIIHIQDLHCNYDAQMSIYNIVNKLVNEHDFKLVAIEGTAGRLETEPVYKNPEEEVREMVAQYYVRTGKFGGAAYAHVMNKGSFAFWGADDTSLHAKNTSAFKKSLKLREKNSIFCENIKTILSKFKHKVYNKKLLNFDTQTQAYKRGTLVFGKYAVYLNEISKEEKIEKQPYGNFNKLISVLELEKQIDFAAVDTQRSKCVDALSKRLKDEKLSELLDKSLNFKTGKVGAVEFYTYLKGLVDNNKRVSFDKYQELGRYITYIFSYHEIQHAQLFKEIDQIQSKLENKMFTREIEKELNDLSKNIDILQQFSSLKLTTRTLDHYRKNRSSFLASNFTNFITKNAPTYRIKYRLDPAFRNVDAQLPDLEEFYSLALERDRVLVENTINKMGEANIKKAVLVAGGFHTDGIIDNLKKKGISYLVITPNVNELDEKNSLYMRVISGKKTPFEEFMQEQISVNKKQ